MGVVSEQIEDAREPDPTDESRNPQAPVSFPDPFMHQYNTDLWELDTSVLTESAGLVSLLLTVGRLTAHD